MKIKLISLFAIYLQYDFKNKSIWVATLLTTLLKNLKETKSTYWKLTWAGSQFDSFEDDDSLGLFGTGSTDLKNLIGINKLRKFVVLNELT